MNFIILVILPQTQSPEVEVTTFYQFVRIRLRADHDLVLPDPDSFIFDPTTQSINIKMYIKYLGSPRDLGPVKIRLK